MASCGRSPRRRITHMDVLEAYLRWALEHYVRPAIEKAEPRHRRHGLALRIERERLERADALLTEGGALGSQRQPGGRV
jgi:hypothetical protein